MHDDQNKSNVKTVTADTFQADVLEHKGLSFVDFHAEWCGPCKMTEPIVAELSADPKFGNFMFAAVDVDTAQDIAVKYNIFSIPTFMIFKDGEVVDQWAGANDKSFFEGKLKAALESQPTQ